MSAFEAPIPLSDIEMVLAWVDTFKLSRPTKKINRDFSDAVLLAEILNVYYPKLVEMHNYPPRNSHALKLNNWMTLNRKVLRKLKLNLCCSTMEQLANCAPGVIERVLIMVREKIRRDEELNKSKEDQEQVSSGGCYYDACGDDEHVLVVPLKSRVNGVLETIQQKVVSHELYLTAKQEIKDLQDCNDVLKNKVEHLDNLLKLKDERIEELQKQLERKQTRRKEVEALQNSLSVPFDSSPPTPKITDLANLLTKSASMKFNESVSRIPVFEDKAKDEIILMKSDDSVAKSLISATSKPSNEIILIKPEDPVTKSLISATSKPSNEIKLAKSEDTVSKSLVSATSKPSNEIKLAKSEETVSKSLVSATSKPSNEIKLIKSENTVPKSVVSISSKPTVKPCESISKIPKLEDFYLRDVSKVSKGEDKELKGSEERILKVESIEKFDLKESKQSLTGPKPSEIIHIGAVVHDVDRDDSKIFQEYEIHEERSDEYIDEFKDSVEDVMVTIEDSIKKEVKEIFNPLEFANQNFI